jgi:cyclophilin family peptidyl-prolyl cis-trans isomerase
MVTFAKTRQPNTRSTQVFINKGDNSIAPAYLDKQGFAPFAEVIEGMDIVDSWFITGDSTVDQAVLVQRGIEYFREVMPDGDVITKAYIKPAS